MSEELIASLTRAVEASGQDVALRLHLADLLVSAGRADEAVGHCAIALQQEPANARARELMGRALGGTATPQEEPHGSGVMRGGSRSFDWIAA